VNSDRSRVREAFDRHAGVYDQLFSRSSIGQEIRAEVWQIAGDVFSQGMKILDLGCGTGEDAIHFARQGLQVTAIDASPAMVNQLQLKAGADVDCEVAEMEHYSPRAGPYDGILSNFGALNCTGDLDWLRYLCQCQLKRGGHLVLGLMGRFYPLETAMFLMKGKPSLAFRRFGSRCMARIEGVSVPVHYYSPRAIQRSLGPEFVLERLKGLRSLQPVPGLEHLSRFRAVQLLRNADRWITRQPWTACWADHFVSVWRYREK
jgi:SAM-dependent methyltransferase